MLPPQPRQKLTSLRACTFLTNPNPNPNPKSNPNTLHTHYYYYYYYLLSYLQRDRQTYEHVVPEGIGLEAFCTREVETMGIEADEPQVCTPSLVLTLATCH